MEGNLRHEPLKRVFQLVVGILVSGLKKESLCDLYMHLGEGRKHACWWRINSSLKKCTFRLHIYVGRLSGDIEHRGQGRDVARLPLIPTLAGVVLTGRRNSLLLKHRTVSNWALTEAKTHCPLRICTGPVC